MARAKCKHCGDIIHAFTCDKCKEEECDIEDQCRECHEELKHGVVQNQNIHIIGHGSGDSVDDDLDAWNHPRKD